MLSNHYGYIARIFVFILLAASPALAGQWPHMAVSADGTPIA